MPLSKITSSAVDLTGAVSGTSIVAGSIVESHLGAPLSTRLNTPYIKKQIVHRRPVYGVGTLSMTSGDVYRADSTMIAYPYGPFSYGVPGVQSGAERRFRLYCCWSDSSQAQGDVQVLFRPNDSATNQVVFTIGATWGGLGTAQRDGYSNEVVGTPWTDHASIRITGSGTVNYGVRMHYIEVQALDVWL